MLLHRTIFSARSVFVFLGSTLLFYVALIGTGKCSNETVISFFMAFFFLFFFKGGAGGC